MSDRPSTSKARGVCKYYKEPRGCFAGSRCKFFHGEPGATDGPTLTPYDASKTCRFFAKGYCNRGDSCWFRHVQSEVSSSRATLEDVEDDQCCICFEKPTTYGLLGGCSHVFCLSCLRQWRSTAGKSIDVVESGVHKKCPMCRSKSAFITPSSVFIKHGDPAKDEVIQAYKESMARIPCVHFQSSKARGRLFCPFGRDCFYQHLNDDGTPYIFSEGAMGRSHTHRNIFPFAQTPVMDGNFFTSSLDILDEILQDPPYNRSMELVRLLSKHCVRVYNDWAMLCSAAT
ncbi:hypothetical protein BD626DRAFT_406853 [Schizophyllum amplum]|uniref:RING-type E3 ubiquitin transferase n=1 Tax=Schizophyllum amplum TaxID=97359 RepID=A0A550C7E7_9AGAR|nr:hypothetical protein BD626DRAFT_406853 [Auriculariopsis ampla]